MRALLRMAIWGGLTVAGVAAVLVCGYWGLVDWAALDAAYLEYRRQIASGANLRRLFIANSFQEIHRINCFADGVGFMLGSMVFSLGCLGWQRSYEKETSKP